jgi:hypothetical protein
MRQQAAGEPVHQLRLFHTNKQGELVIAANPLLTNLVPAVLVGLVIRPHWLWSFVGGVIGSGLMGERSERAFFDLLQHKDG